MIGSRYNWKISTTHTLDGVEVKPGLKVWDYDLRPVEVVRHCDFMDQTADGGREWWWVCRPLDGGHNGGDMNASRMWFWHPSTGKPAA